MKTFPFLAFVLAAGLSARAAVPSVVTYQGRVSVSNAVFTGGGQFKFALVNGGTNISTQATATANPPSGGFITVINVTFGGAGYGSAPAVNISGGGGSGATATASVSGGAVTSITVNNPGSGYTTTPSVTIAPPPVSLLFVTYWSNDGSSVAGSQPASAVSLSVVNGLFVAALGNTNLANMAALPANLFTNANVGLRIWFSDGTNGFAQLSPDQPLTTAPYAMLAQNLAGSVSAAQIGGTLSVAQLPGAALTNNATGVTLNGSFTGNGAGVTNVNAASLNGLNSSNFWRLDGNNVSSTQFLGSTNNQPLEFRVNNLRALRLENNGDSTFDLNTAPDGAPNLIGGSPHNFVGAGVVGATIAGGGATNLAGLAYTNSVLAHFGVVGGGVDNTIETNSLGGTIAGGGDNTIETNSIYATIAGGSSNDIGTNSGYSAIGGGINNNIAADSQYATIAGGRENDIGTNSTSSAIGGGLNNNIAANSQYATIAGGFVNDIGTNSTYSAIGGGYDNNIAANSQYATIAGGRLNDIGTNSTYSAIGGGYDNNIAANSQYATIAGGNINDIGTNSGYSAIGGGTNNNIASNSPHATIPGGRDNTATNLAFAAGNNAKATNSGAFVWSDGTGTATGSISNNSVTMRGSGGFRFLTGTSTAGAQLLAGATAWSVISDRSMKKDFAAVDAVSILEKLAAMPVTQWRYNWEDAATTPHIGPMAQDFKRTFYPGSDDKSISTLEADGVALAAIQGLNEKVEVRSQKSEVRIRKLEAENAALKARLEKLEQMLNNQTGATK